LDEKDLKILTALDGLGGNASAQQISDYIHNVMEKKKEEKPIPARTIRYNISTLIERGVLLPPILQTDERKIGLGEGILILHERPTMSRVLEKLIQKIPIFYWYVPTHGRYDGFLIHTVFDITQPEMIAKIAESMKKTGLINDFSFFEIVDNESKKIDFTKFNRESNSWLCDWQVWKKNIEKNLKEAPDSPFNLSKQHEMIECDWRDILILRVLKNDPDAAMRSLVSITAIPVQQVRERVQRLRDSKVIKGYSRAYGFAGDLLWFSCFMKIKENVGGILKSIHELPFPGVVLMADDDHYCVRFALSTSNLKQFLDGFRLIRPNLNEYFFQFHLPDRIETKYEKIFDLFDREEGRWNIPVQDYIKIVREHSEK